MRNSIFGPYPKGARRRLMSARRELDPSQIAVFKTRRVFSTGEAALAFGVSCRTMTKWCDNERIPGVYRLPPSQDRRIPREGLRKLAEQIGNREALTLLAGETSTPFLFASDTSALAGTIAGLAAEGCAFIVVRDLFEAGIQYDRLRPAAVALDFGLGREACLAAARSIRKADAACRLVAILPEAYGITSRELGADGFDDAWRCGTDPALLVELMDGPPDAEGGRDA
jgi:hypothetical protein